MIIQANTEYDVINTLLEISPSLDDGDRVTVHWDRSPIEIEVENRRDLWFHECDRCHGDGLVSEPETGGAVDCSTCEGQGVVRAPPD
jgi:hypothetical protein